MPRLSQRCHGPLAAHVTFDVLAGRYLDDSLIRSDNLSLC